jgi:hypothetical protein
MEVIDGNVITSRFQYAMNSSNYMGIELHFKKMGTKLQLVGFSTHNIREYFDMGSGTSEFTKLFTIRSSFALLFARLKQRCGHTISTVLVYARISHYIKIRHIVCLNTCSNYGKYELFPPIGNNCRIKIALHKWTEEGKLPSLIHMHTF